MPGVATRGMNAVPRIHISYRREIETAGGRESSVFHSGLLFSNAGLCPRIKARMLPHTMKIASANKPAVCEWVRSLR